MRVALVMLLLTAFQAQAATATLTWDAVTNATGYKVLTAVGTGAFALAAAGSATTATLQVNTNVLTRFQVVATNATSESLPSNVVTNFPFIPTPPLSAPMNLRITQVQARRYDVGFSADAKASTDVERSDNNAPFTVIDTLPPGTMHTSTQLQKRKRYAFRARSFNAATNSPYSPIVTIVTR